MDEGGKQSKPQPFGTPYKRINKMMLRLSSLDLTEGRKISAIVVVTMIVLSTMVISLSQGVNVIFPHFFYVPIIMAAYWYPHRGIIYSFGLASAYVLGFLYFHLVAGTIPSSEWVPVAARCLVYLVVGSVMAVLRWEGFTLNRIIGDQDKFVFMRDKELGYFYFSPSAYSFVRRGDIGRLNDQGMLQVIEEKDKERFLSMERRVLEGERCQGEFDVRGADKRIHTYQFSFMPLVSGGSVQGYEAIAEDVTSIMQYEASLESALEEKTVLLAELHHRVKNNLAQIIGLLNMQLSNIEDENTRKSLLDAEARIMALSSVYSFVYQDEQFMRIDFSSHLTRLLNQIAEGNSDADGLEIDIRFNGLQLDHHDVSDLSIIITELFTNTLKHGMVDGRGRFSVDMKKDGNEYEIEVSDEGPGPPRGFDPEEHSNLGLKVAMGAVKRKLRGTMEHSSDGGMVWTIRFPASRS